MQQIIHSQETYIVTPDIFTIELSSSNVTLETIRGDTILIKGVLTANVSIFFPLNIRRYKIINSCIGAYTVTLRTQYGAGFDSYVNDVLDIYCNGTDIKLIGWNENMITGVERLTPQYWRGYPVYAKMLTRSGLASGVTNTAHGISGTFSVVEVRGSQTGAGGSYSFGAVHVDGTNPAGGSFSCVVTNTYLTTYAGAGYGENSGFNITIYYIKA